MNKAINDKINLILERTNDLELIEALNQDLKRLEAINDKKLYYIASNKLNNLLDVVIFDLIH